CPAESYGGGRYLFDTIKGSEFLPVPGIKNFKRIMLDFNYAYNPSCAYNYRWICPLAPMENRLNVAIRAGELKYTPGGVQVVARKKGIKRHGAGNRILH